MKQNEISGHAISLFVTIFEICCDLHANLGAIKMEVRLCFVIDSSSSLFVPFHFFPPAAASSPSRLVPLFSFSNRDSSKEEKACTFPRLVIKYKQKGIDVIDVGTKTFPRSPPSRFQQRNCIRENGKDHGTECIIQFEIESALSLLSFFLSSFFHWPPLFSLFSVSVSSAPFLGIRTASFLFFLERRGSS